MTDIPKVITSLTAVQTNNPSGASNSRNYTKAPESDRPVMYNTCGYLELSNEPVRGSYHHVNDTATEADARRNSQYAQVLSGAYFNTNRTTGGTTPLIPSVVGPNVSHLICINGDGANITWEWPNLDNLCTYLREAFPGMYRPGMSWDTWITNHRGGGAFTLTLQFSANAVGQTVLTYGQNTANNDEHLIPVASPNSPSILIRTLITSTVLGSERFEFFVLQSGV